MCAVVGSGARCGKSTSADLTVGVLAYPTSIPRFGKVGFRAGDRPLAPRRAAEGIRAWDLALPLFSHGVVESGLFVGDPRPALNLWCCVAVPHNESVRENSGLSWVWRTKTEVESSPRGTLKNGSSAGLELCTGEALRQLWGSCADPRSAAWRRLGRCVRDTMWRGQAGHGSLGDGRLELSDTSGGAGCCSLWTRIVSLRKAQRVSSRT